MGAVPSPRHARTVLGWIALALALVAIHGVWSLSIPPMASPDEPSHVVRAAAVARGQWSGELHAAPSGSQSSGPATTVQLPSDYAPASASQTCFAFSPDQPASCQRPIPAPDGTTVGVDTFAGEYPPLYYALVGWPSRFLSASASVYAMRIVSGVIASTLLVWGLYRLRKATLPPAWMWGAIAALTPMTLFMGAMVNPQALEISSAFAFWAACLVLARSAGMPSRGTVVQVAVTGALLLNTRSSGPVWALLIVAVSMVLARKGRLRELWGLRSIRWAVAAAGLAAAAWVATHGSVVSGTHAFRQFSSPFKVARVVLAQTYAYLQQMVGNFGWLDTPSPGLTLVVWCVLVGTLLTVALAGVSSRRIRVALLLSALAVVVVPVALQLPTAVDVGLVWQGRYTLPAAVGVPMVAAVALTSVAGPLDEVVRRIVRWAAVPSVAVAHVAAFLWAMRRYSVGSEGQLISRSPAWSSPLGYLPAVAIYAVPVATLALAAWWAMRPTTPPAPAATATAMHEKVPEPAI